MRRHIKEYTAKTSKRSDLYEAFRSGLTELAQISCSIGQSILDAARDRFLHCNFLWGSTTEAAVHAASLLNPVSLTEGLAGHKARQDQHDASLRGVIAINITRKGVCYKTNGGVVFGWEYIREDGYVTGFRFFVSKSSRDEEYSESSSLFQSAAKAGWELVAE